MEKTKPKRRRRSKPKVENYYKILGLRSNTRHEKIKEKYIQLVMEFPPEQYPEEFERIRRAYETLRDPIKRQEYDLMRKFGGSLEKTIEEAQEYMEQENWDEAEKLFSKLLKVAPKMVGARIGLAQIQIMKNDFEQFEKQTQLLFEMAETVEEQVSALSFKVKMLNDMNYPDEALTILELLSTDYPDYTHVYRFMYIQVYQALGREEEALKLFELEVPSLDEQEPDHIFFFIGWINTMMDMEKWQLSDKIQKRVRKFFKSIEKDSDDKFMIESSLINEYESYFDGALFREAGFYMDLLYYLNPKHPLVIQERANVQELARIHKEFTRLSGDENQFPLTTIQAVKWFYDEVGHSDVVSESNSVFPFEIMKEMELMDEEYAASIKRLQKKYPLIYRRYKKEWDSLFEEKTAGLNREARRRLR